MTRILLVDDQRSLRRSLSLMLQSAGFETAEAASGAEALGMLENTDYDLVISDLRMEGMSGADLLREIRVTKPALPVIIITAYGSIESAVDAMRLGAFDYLTKPFRELDIIEKIRSSQALRGFESAAGPAAGRGRRQAPAPDIIAETPQMRALLIRIQRLAASDISVLITGETGTGKTRIARLIHELSSRVEHPFVGVNCAAVPEQLLESELFGHTRGSFTGAVSARTGLFEEADKGTIFLDEIDTLSPAMQAKLLSVLQEKKIRPLGSNTAKGVDIRIISASNQDIRALIDKGTFRSDLYFRINGVRLDLLPLRERGNDIRLLLERFLKRYGVKYGRSGLRLTARALSYVLAYPYPGNIRQLESFVEQMVVFAGESGVIDVESLPEELLNLSAAGAAPLVAGEHFPGGSIAESERQLIEATLQRFPQIADAAKHLGIGRTTLWRRMRQYNISHEPAIRRKKQFL